MTTVMEAKRQSERISGVPNISYDLLTMLTHKLQCVAALEEYKLDAIEAGDEEVRMAFEGLEQRATEDIRRLRELFAQRMR